MSNNIYKNKINTLKTKIQEQYYYHPIEVRKQNNVDINDKIKNLFSSDDFIYKINCIIDYKDNSSEKEIIIAKKDNYLLTLDNKKIFIQDIYDIHKDRKYSRELYGGKASTLDYYPHEKIEFEDNPLLKNAKTMYLNGSSQVISNVDKYLEIATTSGVNAIVVDIKDGALAYPSEIAKEYSMTAYNTAMNNLDNYKVAIKKIKDAGIYVIGRIVVFNDYHFGKDHPEECIKSPVSSRLWPSAYSRLAWEYNVELAKEAVDLMGFNEIQFDYVRFPEDA